eukprot:TRINITY_DN63990_c0_g1_i1.p1 TRINITY_DN63990_c0_g1~~TRINITY_DN63990_c0_g1_i1.p1  ORF type:complete len:141 (+),score=25.11 TRINITY_DN63990_c0_g1_i1:645-1067(+)
MCMKEGGRFYESLGDLEEIVERRTEDELRTENKWSKKIRERDPSTEGVWIQRKGRPNKNFKKSLGKNTMRPFGGCLTRKSWRKKAQKQLRREQSEIIEIAADEEESEKQEIAPATSTWLPGEGMEKTHRGEAQSKTLCEL